MKSVYCFVIQHVSGVLSFELARLLLFIGTLIDDDCLFCFGWMHRICIFKMLQVGIKVCDGFLNFPNEISKFIK